MGRDAAFADRVLAAAAVLKDDVGGLAFADPVTRCASTLSS